MSTASSAFEPARFSIPSHPSTSVILNHQLVGPILERLLSTNGPIWQYRVASMPLMHPPIRLNILELDSKGNGLRIPTTYMNLPNPRGEDALDIQRWVIEAAWALGAPAVRRDHVPAHLGTAYYNLVSDIWDLGLPGRVGTGPTSQRWRERIMKLGFYRWDVNPLATMISTLSPAAIAARRRKDPTLDHHGRRALPVPAHLVIPPLHTPTSVIIRLDDHTK